MVGLCKFCLTLVGHAIGCPRRGTLIPPDYSINEAVTKSGQFTEDKFMIRQALIQGDGKFAVVLREIFERRERAARFSVCIK